jgi:hypothetical protein
MLSGKSSPRPRNAFPGPAVAFHQFRHRALALQYDLRIGSHNRQGIHTEPSGSGLVAGFDGYAGEPAIRKCQYSDRRHRQPEKRIPGKPSDSDKQRSA